MALRLFALLGTVLPWVAAEFKPIDFLRDYVACDVKLSASVPFQCRSREAKDQKYDVWKTSLDFYFGNISEKQWQALRRHYTAAWAGPKILQGHTPLFEPYNASREYSLKDFLPITIRALVDHDFIEEDGDLPVDQPLPPLPPLAPTLHSKTILVPNCWATVYETLRTMTQNRDDDVDVFHEVYSTDDKDAQAWLEGATTVVPGSSVAAERKFGDIMFVFLKDKGMKRTVLEHAVVFVDQDLVFEKAGTGDKNPYRLIDLATVEKEWKPTSQGGLFQWVLHRPFFGVEQRKPFAQRFSLQAQQPDPRWPQFWQWPQDLQAQYTLGRGDNPRNPEEVDELTLLKSRRYSFRRRGDAWEPYEIDLGIVREQFV